MLDSIPVVEIIGLYDTILFTEVNRVWYDGGVNTFTCKATKLSQDLQLRVGIFCSNIPTPWFNIQNSEIIPVIHNPKSKYKKECL